MASSFEKINYSLRPNKSIERKMMCEVLERLSFIEHLERYRYIGFGSPYFADFILFHKHLGIKDLISIEKDESKKLRFEFNIPYSGIKMHYGKSETILPNLQLEDKKNIIWLDYDDKISESMFSDVNTIFFNTQAGSFFILSVNVEEIFLDSRTRDISLKDYRMNKLIKDIDKNRLPNEYSDINLNTKNLADVTYEMLSRQIKTTLLSRNGELENKIHYKQLFNFVYKDNATILTIGGIIYDDSQQSKIEEMEFNNFPFIKSEKEAYKIESPNLTIREIKALDKALPDILSFKNGQCKNKKILNFPLIQSDIEKYAKVYRYFPNFTEVSL